MISILCPTRGRPDMVRRLMTTAEHYASGDHRLEFVFYVDDDDTATIHTLWTVRDDADIKRVTAPRGQVPMSDWWNHCAAIATGDILMFTDDEALFQTYQWDLEVIRVFEGWSDKAILVQPNDLCHGDANAGYFFVHRTWFELFGRITPRQFTYGYADIWPMEVAQAVGRKIYLSEVVVENTAPKNQPPDIIHRENQIRDTNDRNGDRYNATQPEREEDVQKLRTYTKEHR